MACHITQLLRRRRRRRRRHAQPQGAVHGLGEHAGARHQGRLCAARLLAGGPGRLDDAQGRRARRVPGQVRGGRARRVHAEHGRALLLPALATSVRVRADPGRLRGCARPSPRACGARAHAPTRPPTRLAHRARARTRAPLPKPVCVRRVCVRRTVSQARLSGSRRWAAWRSSASTTCPTSTCRRRRASRRTSPSRWARCRRARPTMPIARLRRWLMLSLCFFRVFEPCPLPPSGLWLCAPLSAIGLRTPPPCRLAPVIASQTPSELC